MTRILLASGLLLVSLLGCSGDGNDNFSTVDSRALETVSPAAANPNCPMTVYPSTVYVGDTAFIETFIPGSSAFTFMSNFQAQDASIVRNFPASVSPNNFGGQLPNAIVVFNKSGTKQLSVNLSSFSSQTCSTTVNVMERTPVPPSFTCSLSIFTKDIGIGSQHVYKYTVTATAQGATAPQLVGFDVSGATSVAKSTGPFVSDFAFVSDQPLHSQQKNVTFRATISDSGSSVVCTQVSTVWAY